MVHNAAPVSNQVTWASQGRILTLSQVTWPISASELDASQVTWPISASELDASQVTWPGACMLSSQWKFQSLGQPCHWWLTAASMKEAAELIFEGVAPAERTPSAEDLDRAQEGFELAHPSPDLRSVYVMLVGFSLENLLKAEYMRRNPTNLEDGRLPDRITKGHSLRDLCKLAAFEPRADEAAMFADASQAIISWGRYPGGLRHDHGGMHAPDCFDLVEFRRAFEAVYWRLTEVITEGWGE